MTRQDPKIAQSVSAVRSALQYVMSSEMPSEHKVVLIDVLTASLREQDEQQVRSPSCASSEQPWQEGETQTVKSFLEGKSATSWQHADELLMHLSHMLGREPQSVRSRAAELGYGESIDYRLARTLAAERLQADDSDSTAP